MGLRNLIVGATSFLLLLPQPVPTVSRPSPETIVVSDAEYATLTPWEEVYAIRDGIEFGYGHVYEEGTIVYLVNPEVDYNIIMYSFDNPDTEEIDREMVEAPVPVSDENRLDWFLYNRLVWEKKYNEYVAENDIGYFEIHEAMQRVMERVSEE